MSGPRSGVDRSRATNISVTIAVTSQPDDVRMAGVTGISTDTAAAPSVTSQPAPPEPVLAAAAAAVKDDGFYVKGEDFIDAAQILMKYGRLVICGPPQSGKTYFAHALLQFFRRKGYEPLFDYELCHSCQEGVGPKGKGPKRILLKEVGFDELRAADDVLSHLASFLNHTPEVWQGPEWSCLVVVTILPHLLVDVGIKEYSPDTTVLNFRQIIVHMKSDPHNLSRSFVPSVDTILPFVTRVLRQQHKGSAFSCMLVLALQGTKYLYYSPETQPELKRLGYSEKMNFFEVEQMYRFLKDVLFHKNNSGFINRGVYDACGLGLARVGAMELLLRVCDVKFIVDYIRFHEEAKPSLKVLVIPKSRTAQRTLMFDRMHELIVNKGAGRELSQHPSLGYSEAVDKLAEYCRSQSSLTKKLVLALDEQFKLPLLYWSLWHPSHHLSQMCLKMMVGTVTREMDLTVAVLTSILACVFLLPPGSSVHPSVKSFVMKLSGLYFRHDSRTVNMTFPFLESDDAEVQAKTDSLKRHAQSRLCYLGDPALAIPPKLLSLTVSEEAIKLSMSKENWYLVLRLLTDTKREERDQLGNTVLHVAAKIADAEVLRMIVKSGASLLVQNRKGLMPPQVREDMRRHHELYSHPPEESQSSDLFAATKDGDLETVKVLLCQGVSLQCQDRMNNTPLHLASAEGHKEIVSLFMQLRARMSGQSIERHDLLHDSRDSGHIRVARVLLAHGADVGRHDSHGSSPLHEACRGGFTDLVALLLQHGADVNCKNRIGITPLYLACHGGHVEAAELLLQTDVDINHRNGSEGMTALHAACQFGHIQVVDLLLRRRADTRLRDSHGRTPADIVREMRFRDPVFDQILDGI